MSYYIISKEKNDENMNVIGYEELCITCDEKRAIEIHDDLVDKYNTGDFHFSTWKEEDPEGYSEDWTIDTWASINIVVDKVQNKTELFEMLKDFVNSLQ